jgi:hypothetical protein
VNTEFAKSLADFQQGVGTIVKNSKGYGYAYADLAQILTVINPHMRSRGLAFTQIVDKTDLVTILIHVPTGETLESRMEIPQGVELKGMNQYQVLGSAISYLRRYQLAAILGIVTDADNDAAGEQQTAQPKLTDERFQAALDAINKGNYKPEDLRKKYSLTDTQIKILEENGY